MIWLMSQALWTMFFLKAQQLNPLEIASIQFVRKDKNEKSPVLHVIGRTLWVRGFQFFNSL